MTEPEQQSAALVENMLLLRREDFDELLDRAAERGAERCLAHLGLENGSAAKDIRELRDLLEAWRAANVGNRRRRGCRRGMERPGGAARGHR
jgi:hypothetical protein